MGRRRLLAILGAALAVGCATAPQRPAARIALPQDPAAAKTEVAGEADEADGEVETTDDAPVAETGPCPADMALVEADRKVCVDKYEASLVETAADGTEKPYPHYQPVDGHVVRAVSVPGVFPQGFISEVQARDACAASNKRLCTHVEWKTACMGPGKTTFPYGQTRMTGVCHDNGKSAVVAVFGAKAVAASTSFLPPRTQPSPAPAATSKTVAKKGGKPKNGKGDAKTAAKGTKPSTRATKKVTANAKRIAGKKSERPKAVDPGVWAKLNDPALGQVEGALGKTGEHIGCVNGWGVYDMVGNIHEWVATDAALPNGTFAGGYYLDTTQNGDGCHYRTVAHAHEYHDYSTGFRCCADPADPR